MSQTVPATAVLGAGQAGLTIGFRVLDIDRVQYSAFSTTGVVETSTPGTYSKSGGVVAPNAGGYIIWGTSGTDLAEDEIAPSLLWSGSSTGSGAYYEDVVGDAGDTLESLSNQIDGVGSVGSGDIFIYTLTYNGSPIAGALIEAYSDVAMTIIIDYGITDAFGKVRLALDLPGTFYIKRTKVGYTFINPDIEVVP